MTDFALHVRRGGEFMKEGTSGCITDSKYGEVKCDSESKCHWVFENEFMPISAPFDLSS